MKFTKIMPHIYHLYMPENYDLAMHFLRYQEYYENPRWIGQLFTLVDYMESYAKSEGKGVFSYPDDWSGFNVPSNVLIEISEADLPDLNKYDIQMRSLVETVRREEGGHKFYFIGTCGDDEDVEATLDHEIGHALWFSDENYREVMEDLLNKMPQKNYDATWEALQEMGYHPSTCRDEIHAYATTGPCDELKKTLPVNVRKPFIKAYKAERKRIKKG